MNPFEHIKHWKGTIIYQKGYGIFKNKELYFELEVVDVNNQNFSATSKDISGFGVNPSIAKISGEFFNQNIRFIKFYTHDLYFDKNENFYLNENNESLPIHYEGKYSQSEQKFKGNWKMTYRYKLFWLIPLSYSLNGIWFMEPN